MRRIKASGFVVIALLLLCRFASADIILIANNSVKETSISKGEVKRAFLGKKKRWADKQKINTVTLKKGAVHKDFVKKYINKSPSSFSSFWKRALVTGTGIPPKSFNTESDIVKYIEETQGGIGYISSDTPHDGVKVLSIE